MNSSINTIFTKSPNTSITIAFDNPSKSYFAGEMICGTVTFMAQENQSVQTFSVQLRGEFYFTKDECEKVENIFTESSPMDYRGAGEGNVEMDFNLVIKPNCPTSIYSSLGGIRYCVVATVVYSKNDSLQIDEAFEPISVNQPHQLPEDCPERSVNIVERSGMLCWVRTIIAEFKISSANLLTGQAAMISGLVTNDTKSIIQATTVNLVQTVERVKDGKKVKRNVLSLEKGVVPPGKKQSWISEHIIVPPIPPTSVDLYFRVSYDMSMELQKVNGKLIKLKIPVKIGNLPAKNGGFPSSFSGDTKFEWKRSEDINVSDKCAPLYATHAP